MKKLLEIGCLVTLLLIGSFSCGGSNDFSSTIDTSATVSATYSSISAVILTPGCVGCHGGSGGFSFDSYSNTMKAVVAGSPSTSKLFTVLSSGSMPQDGTHPTTTQIQAISDWITAGALDN